jgi:imidazolonepropionase-like amidohydrolase
MVDVERIHEIDLGSRGWPNTDVLDLTGLTILPGLIDAHSHLGVALPYTLLSHRGSASAAELAAHIFHNCALALDAGFTTCRELGGVDGGVARAIEAGLVRGPRILPSGPAIAQDGGHVTFMPPYADIQAAEALPGLYQFAAVCNGPEDVRLAARRAFRRGATQLKLMATGGLSSPSGSIQDAQLSVDEIHAAVEEAAAHHTYVTAHAHTLPGLRNAVAAGVRCIEHGSYLDEATASLMQKEGVALVPTLTVIRLMRDEHAAWGVPEKVVPQLHSVEKAMREAIGCARQAGLTIGFGSDLPGSNQNRRGLEFALRAEVDGAMQALVAATSINARILGISDRLGTVETGKIADLIVVDGDPLAEPRLLDDPSRVMMVIKGGQIVKDLRPDRRG